MFDSDKKQFFELIMGFAELYRLKEKPSQMAVRLFFGALSDYTIDQIMSAADIHAKKSKFFPTPADFITILDGGEITQSEIIAMARLAKTPLGCLARIHIGTWDLDTQNAFYLADRASECLALLPEWRSAAKNGDYTDHQLSVMLKHNVNPVSAFADGIAGPANPALVVERANRISGSERHLAFIEKVEPAGNDKKSKPHPSVQILLNKIMDEI